MSGEDFASLLKRVAGGETLDADESARAFGAIMAGEVSELRIAALATAMAVRKPTVDEIVGAVRAMRGAMKSIEANPYAIDLCGTGGDGIGTLNISTACAFVVAALRRAGGQARQPQHVVQERHGRLPRSAGRQDRPVAGGGRRNACARPGCAFCSPRPITRR